MQQFLKKNSLYWRRHDEGRKQGGGLVLIDMLVGHPGYLMSGALLGKYLQRMWGCELAGLVPPAANAGAIKQVAASYGITQFIHEDDPPSQGRAEEIDDWFKHLLEESRLAPQSRDSLRRTLLALEFDGVLIGDLIFDMYLRNTGLPTVTDPQHCVEHGVKPGLVRLARALTVLDGLRPQAAIMGHTVYDRYGFLTRFLTKQGGRVYGRKGAAPPYHIKVYKKPEDFPWPEVYPTADDLAFIERHYRAEALELAQADMRQRLGGRQSFAQSNTAAFTSDRRTYTRQELAEATGTVAGRRNVFIMSQCLSDAPHTTADLLFDDYGEWLIRTADVAKEMPDINWIFKEHPEQEHYSKDWNCKNILDRYFQECPNIAYCPPDLTQRNMTEIVDAGVCVHDAGVEFSMNGIPTLTPGAGMTAAAGISPWPRTREEYIALLRALPYRPPLDEAAKERAALLWYSFRDGRVPCRFVPEHSSAWNNPSDPKEVFAESALRLDGATVEDDPLFRNFRYLVENDLDYMHDFVRMGVIS